MEAPVYNQKGVEVSKVNLPKAVFGAVWNEGLVHEVTLLMAANDRNQTAHSKGRGEVSGGGKKPWRQKGTGRARHGSSRSPIWVGGGVTHGPTKEKVYFKKINKKKKAKALYSVLSRKLKDNEVLFLDTIKIKEPKTSEAKKILRSLSKVPGFESVLKKRKNSAILSFSEINENVLKSFGNFGNIVSEELRNLNPLLLLQYKYLIIVDPETALSQISNRL